MKCFSHFHTFVPAYCQNLLGNGCDWSAPIINAIGSLKFAVRDTLGNY